MRLSASLRRHRWLVLLCWLLALVPSVTLALTQSNQLTGGGFDVAGSQSLKVQYQLQDHYPQLGASPLALVAAPRADATYPDMADAVAQLEQAAGMMQRQLDGQQQNAAMLQSTVADLNAKRDLLSAEVRHLQERLEQESALRLAVRR